MGEGTGLSRRQRGGSRCYAIRVLSEAGPTVSFPARESVTAAPRTARGENDKQADRPDSTVPISELMCRNPNLF
jgi:hypothetical protein